VVTFLVIVSCLSRRIFSFRHVTKILSPQLPCFPHLQSRETCNSFRFRSYENCRVSPSKFPFWNSTGLLPHSRLNFFSCNTYGRPASVANKRLTPRLSIAKPCRCNTYKKNGGAPMFKYSNVQAEDRPIHQGVRSLHTRAGRLWKMRTTIEIDGRLMREAMRSSGNQTKRATVEAGLRLLVQTGPHAKYSTVPWQGQLAGRPRSLKGPRLGLGKSGRRRRDWTPGRLGRSGDWGSLAGRGRGG